MHSDGRDKGVVLDRREFLVAAAMTTTTEWRDGDRATCLPEDSRLMPCESPFPLIADATLYSAPLRFG